MSGQGQNYGAETVCVISINLVRSPLIAWGADTASGLILEESNRAKSSKSQVCRQKYFSSFAHESAFTPCIVLLQAMKEEPPPEFKSRDKFLVQSVAVPAEAEIHNVAAIVCDNIHLCLARSPANWDYSGPTSNKLQSLLSKRRRSESTSCRQMVS